MERPGPRSRTSAHAAPPSAPTAISISPAGIVRARVREELVEDVGRVARVGKRPDRRLAGDRDGPPARSAASRASAARSKLSGWGSAGRANFRSCETSSSIRPLASTMRRDALGDLLRRAVRP